MAMAASQHHSMIALGLGRYHWLQLQPLQPGLIFGLKDKHAVCRQAATAAGRPPAAGLHTWQPRGPTRLQAQRQPPTARRAQQSGLPLHCPSRLQKKLQPKQLLLCWLRRTRLQKVPSMQSSAPRPRRHNRSPPKRSAAPLTALLACDTVMVWYLPEAQSARLFSLAWHQLGPT